MIKAGQKVVSKASGEEPVRGVVVAIEQTRIQLKRIQKRNKEGDWLPLIPLDTTTDWFKTPPHNFRVEDYRD